jgi:hypothetical protein
MFRLAQRRNEPQQTRLTLLRLERKEVCAECAVSDAKVFTGVAGITDWNATDHWEKMSNIFDE